MSTLNISKVNYWLNFIQFSLLPGTCVLCRKSTGTARDICLHCLASLPQLDRPCERCALPLPAAGPELRLCGRCMTAPPPFRYTAAAFDYLSPVDRLISGFTYQGRLASGRVLAAELLATLEGFYGNKTLPDVIIPVPLHSRRLRTRGFNQSIEIARPISRALGIPIESSLCGRKRNTSPQKGLSASERRHNLRHAFTINGPVAGFRSAAVLDDVVTTMSTASEISHLLQRHGVEDVHIWSLARTCRFQS